MRWHISTLSEIIPFFLLVYGLVFIAWQGDSRFIFVVAISLWAIFYKRFSKVIKLSHIPSGGAARKISNFNFWLMAGLGVIVAGLTLVIYLGIFSPIVDAILQTELENPIFGGAYRGEFHVYEENSRFDTPPPPQDHEHTAPQMWPALNLIFRIIGTLVFLAVVFFLAYVIIRKILRRLNITTECI